MTIECKVQLVNSRGYNEDKDVFCTCGEHRKIGYRDTADACPTCGTARIRHISTYHGEGSYIENRFEVISKDDKSFHIRRQEFKVSLNTDTGITVKPTHTGELSFSLKDKKIHVSQDGKKKSSTDACVNTFFKGATTEYILRTISTDVNRKLFKFCYDYLGKEGYERNNMWGRGLTRLAKYPAVEMFGLSLVGSNISSLWNNQRAIMRRQELDAPHKMLGISKVFMPYVADIGFSDWTFERLRNLSDTFDGNRLRIILETFRDESNVYHIDDTANMLVELYKDYGYTNVLKTVLYITREVKLEQGINSPAEALTLLRDYVRMCKAMGINHTKYPKSLKKDHDIAQMNYKTNESEFKQKEFAKVIESEDYSSLDLKGKSYSMVRPATVKEVIKEGTSLSHCVASYVDDIIGKKCKILFLRETDALDESLVTVEVRGKVVRQVRGRFNRPPTVEERAFVTTWAKKKELEVKNY